MSVLDRLIVRGRSVLRMNDGAETVTATIPDGTLRLYNDGSRSFIQVFSRATGAWELFTPAGFLTTSSVTGAVTLDATYEVVLADATSGAFTVTLPAAATNEGRDYTVKKVDSSANAVTVDGNGSETIDGETTQVIAIQWDAAHIVSDGSNWLII